MIGALYALCAYLFNREIVQESGGALADFAYFEKGWKLVRPLRDSGVVFSRPDGRGDFSHDDGWAMHPPFSLFLSAEKEKTLQRTSRRFAAHLDGPCTVHCAALGGFAA